ncbi:MAG: penicillin-binding transpeptidase domain-containing protein [Thomasclavelia sp.]
MQNHLIFLKKVIIILILIPSLLCGCASENTASTTDVNTKETISEPKIIEENWEDYFDGINGTAVIYDPANNNYQIYNQEMAVIKRSPCSTFKIISSLIALENKIITPENSLRKWSGEIFWNDSWNQDIDFKEAFQTSCVWYYRQIIDEIGKEVMQEELNELDYGNCDISDWQGTLNNNNNNRSLTGFWIESSLKISPQEQVEVLERIFGQDSQYSKETQENLKEVMLVANQTNIYGKTGLGKSHGVVVDAWFTGFAETSEGNKYFCIYLGKTEDKDVSSTKAKDIALEIISNL